MEVDQIVVWDYVVEMYVVFIVWIYVFQVVFMFVQCLYDRILMLFFDVQCYVFEWFLFMVVDFMEDNFWMGNCYFEIFMMYVFNQNGQVQFIMVGNVECISVFGFFNVQCYVVYQFFIQMVQDLVRGNEFIFFIVEWRGVDVEEYGNGWFINGQGWQCFDILWVVDGVGDVQFVQIGDCDNVVSFSYVVFNLFQIQVSQYFIDFIVMGFVFVIDDSDLLVWFYFIVFDVVDVDNINVVVVVQLGDLYLQWIVKINVWCWYVIDNCLVQWGYVVSYVFVIQICDIVQCGCVNDWEVQLFVGCIEVNEQVEYLIDNLVWMCVWVVNFVDDYDWFQIVGKSFFGYEVCLWYWVIKGIYYQQYRVNYGYNMFNFIFEVGVFWGINDVDMVIILFDCGVFCEDGNFMFFF